MNRMQEITKRMLEIERANMAYNEQTNFGNVPNDKENEIKTMLAEWDKLKAERINLKNK